MLTAWRRILPLALLALALVIPAAPAAAQGSSCFPETGFCIGGRFAEFWNQNGGLAVFGYPISNELSEKGRTVQYFERQRFELHPEHAPPYDVLLGLLGEEVLAQQGIDWHNNPVAPGPVAGCLWFAETQHNVCDQQYRDGFLTYWTTHGLQFDGQPGTSYAESLALFGLPISEPYTMMIEGQSLQVQWFERARFEWHPGNPPEYHVLLGLLGSEVYRPAPPSSGYDNRNSPVDLLASFYDAINRQDYQRAFSYWENPPSSYEQFAQGYANTASVQLIVQPPTFVDIGAGNAHVAIPTALLATQRDGSQQLFAGCYVTHKPNIVQGAVWSLQQAQINQYDLSADLPTLVAQGCASFGVVYPNAVVVDNRSTPVDLLASFYNAINRREYQRAYGYLQSPPISYDQFVQNYAGLTSVQALVQPPTQYQGAAGSSYTLAPTVEIQRVAADGSQRMVAQCFTTRASNVQPDGWWIYRMATTLPPAGAFVPQAISQACSGQ